MKKLLNGVFALVLFSTTANAAEVVTAWINNYTQVSTNPGEKNKANSGINTWTSLSDGVAMITGKAKNQMNIPSEQILKLQAEYMSAVTGMTVTPHDVKSCYENGEYEIWTPAKWTAVTGEKPTNFGTDVAKAQLFVSDVYDPNANLLVLKPKLLPGWSFASLKEGCLNYQEGSFYEPTGDNDEDYSLPVQQSEGLTLDVDNSNENDIDINVPASETNEYGTYIENYYEAGETASSGELQNYPYYDDQLFWGLDVGYSQCGGWSFGASLSNSPYGVSGGGSGYGYNSGYNNGFSGYCAQNGVGGYGSNTTNNYYYFGDVNSHNNNNINSGNTTFNWQQWVNNHNNDDDDPPPPPVIDDPLPTNTGGIAGQATTGDNLPGNNSGTTAGKQKEPSGFKKDYKKSKEKGDEVFYANAEQTKKDEGVKTGNQSKSDNMDGAKAKNDAKAKNEGQSKEKPEFNASADKQIKDQSNERSFEKKSEQEKNQPAEKQFEIKEKPVKQNNTASKSKVEQKKTNNVDENYDRPAKEYQKKKSPEVKKSAPAKEVKKSAPVKKSTTVKGSGAKVKSNPSAKKSSGTKYQKPTSRKSAGSGQNYRNGNNGNRQNGNQNSKTRNSGSSPSPKRGGRS